VETVRKVIEMGRPGGAEPQASSRPLARLDIAGACTEFQKPSALPETPPSMA
jgi:hypothetical protein